MGLLSTLHRGTHSAGVWIELSLRDEGISQAEASILGFLHDHPDGTINDAHHHFGHRRSTLTNVVDRLEARELVHRGPNPISRRSVRLELTETGCDVAADVSELFNWLDESVASRVTDTDLAGFERVIRAIEEVTHDR